MPEKYDKDYYRRYYHYLKRPLFEIPLFAKIEEWVSQEKPKKILDIGCGIGYLLSWLSQETEALGWGIDSSKEAITQAKKLYPKINFFCRNAKKLPFDNNFFDCVLLINLIEHLNEKKQHQVLAEAKRVLKKDGILILSTPEKNSLYKKIMIHDKTHKRELSKKELLELISPYFLVEEIFLTNSIGRFGKTLNFFLSKIFPADLLLKAKKK